MRPCIRRSAIPQLTVSLSDTTTDTTADKTCTTSTAGAGLPRCIDQGKLVEVPLNGVNYKFHAMWLRDACRDENAIVPGERNLRATPVGPLSHVDPTQLAAESASWNIDGKKNELVVTWNEASANIRQSRFTKEFLEKYAPIVAQSDKDDELVTSTPSSTTTGRQNTTFQLGSSPTRATLMPGPQPITLPGMTLTTLRAFGVLITRW